MHLLLVAALEVVECAEQLEQVTLHSIWHANSRVFDGDSQKLLRKLSLIEYFLKGNLDIPTKCVLIKFRSGGGRWVGVGRFHG